MSQKTRSKKLKWYQRQYLVDPEVQLRVILTFVALAVLFSIVLSAISYVWITHLRVLFDGTMFGPMKPAEAFQIVADKLIYRLIGTIVVMAFSITFLGLYTTLRFAGPIWRLQRDLKDFFEGGEFKKTQFRKKDDYQLLPDYINRLVEGYNGPRSSQKRNEN